MGYNMMLTVTMILAILALILAALAGANWVPLWVSVVLLAVLQLLQHVPR
jgi:hypothetical protein